MLIFGDLASNSNINTTVEIKQNDFIIKQDGNIECKIQLQILTDLENVVPINIIDDLNSEPLKAYSDYSMIIYFTKKGENLWDIAKKFRSTKNDILRVNSIEDEKSIVQGMQLFIPKFNVKKSV